MRKPIKLALVGFGLQALLLSDLAPEAPLGLGFLREAAALIGAPLTPMSYAGVARRTTRRLVAVEATAATAATAAAALPPPSRSPLRRLRRRARCRSKPSFMCCRPAARRRRSAASSTTTARPGCTDPGRVPGQQPRVRGGAAVSHCGESVAGQ